MSSDDTSASTLEILLLAPTGRDAALICELLHETDHPCRAVDSMGALVSELRDGAEPGVVVIAEEALDSEKTSALAEYLEGQANWSDLPVLVLGTPHRLSRPAPSLTKYRGVDMLDRPVQPETLTAAIQSSLEIRRRQYEVRDLLVQAQDLSQRLEHRAEQLRRLTLELSDTEERERRRLAEYVHDDLQQILAGVMFHLDITERRLQDPLSARAALQKVRELMNDAIEGTRTLSQELSPTALRSSGLIAALRWLAEHVHSLHGLSVEVDASSNAEPDNQSAIHFLFRAAQELLLNVVKHASTDRARISLTAAGDLLQLSVEDEGAGFSADEEASPESEASFGLFSIRERAEILGGTVQVNSRPGEGTAIRIILPHEARNPDEEVSAEQEADARLAASPAGPGEEPPQVRVVLVDDHMVLRSGLKLLLVEQPGIEVVGELDNGRQAVDAADRLHPDIMVMDVAMPEMDGVEATRAIKREHPEIRIIGLSMFQDRETGQRMLDAGAELYLPKTGPSEELVSAILSS